LEEHHQEAKDPRQTNRNEDGDVDSELLAFLALIGLGCRRQCLVNLSRDEEEEDRIGGDDDQSRQEEECKDKDVVLHIAYSADISVVQEARNKFDTKDREAPAEEMVPLLERL